MSEKANKSTDFGYSQVDWQEKQHKVNAVFDSVAKRYDLMNDVMSLGLHRLWKRVAVDHSGVRPGDRVLDVASGTGDLARAFARRVGRAGQVILTDINGAMLEQGRIRCDQLGVAGNIDFVIANAESLCFAENSFACLSIGFGLRNVRDKEAALASFYRVLKPGAKLLILEFSQPTSKRLQSLYDLYSFHLLPRLGQVIAGDRDSYQYLVESIRKHPDQKTLTSMIRQAGFERVQHINLLGGIVALHQGEKPCTS